MTDNDYEADNLPFEFEYKDDGVFLLSAYEYSYFQKIIPIVDKWYWLRDQGRTAKHASLVRDDGTLDKRGDIVIYEAYCFRPAFNLDIVPREALESRNIDIVMLTNNIAVAKDVQGQLRFDGKWGNYEKSEIRKHCLEIKEELEQYEEKENDYPVIRHGSRSVPER